MTEEDCNNLEKRLETREKVYQDPSHLTPSVPPISAYYYSYIAPYTKYKGMIELYQLRNIKRQTLQSDKVRRHEIIHMLGYHASIYRNQPIKKPKKKQILNKTKSINRNVLRKITGNKVIAQVNQQLTSTDLLVWIIVAYIDVG